MFSEFSSEDRQLLQSTIFKREVPTKRFIASELAVRQGTIVLTYEEIWFLAPGVWISNASIDAYVEFKLMEIGERNGVYFFSSYLYGKLRQLHQDSRGNMVFGSYSFSNINHHATFGTDIWDPKVKSVVFGNNRCNSHWYPIEIDMQRRTIILVDSMSNTSRADSTVFADIQRFLRDSYCQHFSTDVLPAEYEPFEEVVNRRFKQPDGYECGIYTLEYMEAAAHRRSDTYSGLDPDAAVRKRYNIMLLFAKKRVEQRNRLISEANGAGGVNVLLNNSDAFDEQRDQDEAVANCIKRLNIS